MNNGKQLTVAWHVDDLKISHINKGVVDDLCADKEFGKETPLTKSRGSIHDYLGMTFDFSTPGEVTIQMIEYIKSILQSVPMDMSGNAITPATGNLFIVNANGIELDKNKKEIFVHHVMQLL